MSSSTSPVTLAQIARRAGVHISTVSRSLAESSAGVSDGTVQRIRAIADEMGYQPDPAAAMLRTGRSGVIGVLVPRLTDFVLARIFEGVDSAAHEAGYNTVVSSSNDDPALRMELLEKLLARRVEGIVLGDARMDGDELVQLLKRKKIPYVLVNRRLRGHLSVTANDVEGGRLAASHLLELGHTDIGVVAGPDYASTCVERTHGFVQRFLAAGVTVPDAQVLTSSADVEAGHVTAHRLLDANPDITAIFAINDFAAIGAMGAARERGRVPGEDIAIVGYNDIPLAEFLPLPLTSVKSPIFEMGRLGARALTASLAGGEEQSTLLEPTLSARASTLGVRLPG